ncbi:hypothetical protein I7I51_08721 [Histoplasma capsulatum]|uniref:Uncharacterized protein n=1 Tax=Ajellomyces capsulatus TaxID=5037 RepID=A0A8A1LYM2_AJECA|nr:hypothetical protein I7I51_08721 [Histoplasma capsulatum]
MRRSMCSRKEYCAGLGVNRHTFRAKPRDDSGRTIALGVAPIKRRKSRDTNKIGNGGVKVDFAIVANDHHPQRVCSGAGGIRPYHQGTMNWRAALPPTINKTNAWNNNKTDCFDQDPENNSCQSPDIALLLGYLCSHLLIGCYIQYFTQSSRAPHSSRKLELMNQASWTQ